MTDKCPAICSQLLTTSRGQPYCGQHGAALASDGGPLRCASCVGPVVAVRDDGGPNTRATGWRDDVASAVIGHVRDCIGRSGPPQRITTDGIEFDLVSIGILGRVAVLVPVGSMGENAERFERMEKRIKWLRVRGSDARRGVAFVSFVSPGDVP